MAIPRTIEEFNPWKLLWILPILIILFLFMASWTVIDAGERGVVVRLGQVQDTVLPEGLYFKRPLFDSIYHLDIQTQKVDVKSAAASKDLQVVTTEIALNYHLDPVVVNKLFQQYGIDYEARIIHPAIQEAIKASTAKYTAEELITKREAVKDDITLALATQLKDQYLVVDNVSIVNLDFSESFNRAIESKVTAEQDALAAKNKLSQVQFEADQRVAQAKAEAEAIRIQAQAVTSQGGADYVQLQAIKQWNGQLPSSMIPGATVPFINLR